MTFIIPSHNNSNNERNGRRQNWKENMEREATAMDTTAAHTKFDKMAAAFIAAGRVEAISSTETRVYTGAGKTHYTVYKIKGAYKCECRDQEAYGFCSHEKAAAAHAAQAEASVPTESLMIRIDERQDEFAEATLRARESGLQVFDGFGFGTYFVKNPATKKEYQVTVKTIDEKTLASCSCPDFKKRGRICKHAAKALWACFLGFQVDDPTLQAPMLQGVSKTPCGCRYETADRYRECCDAHEPGVLIERLACGCVHDLTGKTVVQCEDCEWDYERAWQAHCEEAYA